MVQSSPLQVPASRIRFTDRIQHGAILPLNVDTEAERVRRLGDVRLIHIIDKRGHQQNVIVADNVSVTGWASRKLAEFFKGARRITGTISADGEIEFIPKR